MGRPRKPRMDVDALEVGDLLVSRGWSGNNERGRIVRIMDVIPAHHSGPRRIVAVMVKHTTGHISRISRAGLDGWDLVPRP